MGATGRRMVGLELPIIPVEHHYLITEPLEIVQKSAGRTASAARSGFIVLHPRRGRRLAGRPLREEHGGVGGRRSPRRLPQQPARARDGPARRVARGLRRASARIRRCADPDDHQRAGRLHAGWPLPDGPRSGPEEFHVLAGFSIFGIVFGGGSGKYAAEWIVEGQPGDNMWELDVRRFDDYASSSKYIVARSLEVYEREYSIHYPEEELPAGRPLKTGPLYDKLALEGRRLRLALRLGAAALVRETGARGRRVFVPSIQLARRCWRRVPGRPKIGRRARPVEFCEIRSLRARRGALPRLSMREQASENRRPNGSDTDVYAAGWHRVRPDRHQARRKPLLRGLRSRDRIARLRVDRSTPARRRQRPTREHNESDRNLDARGAALTRSAAGADRHRHLERGIPILPLQGSAHRLGSGSRVSDLVRGRARLRTPPPDGVPAARLRSPDAGG